MFSVKKTFSTELICCDRTGMSINDICRSAGLSTLVSICGGHETIQRAISFIYRQNQLQ